MKSKETKALIAKLEQAKRVEESKKRGIAKKEMLTKQKRNKLECQNITSSKRFDYLKKLEGEGLISDVEILKTEVKRSKIKDSIKSGAAYLGSLALVCSVPGLAIGATACEMMLQNNPMFDSIFGGVLIGGLGAVATGLFLTDGYKTEIPAYETKFGSFVKHFYEKKVAKLEGKLMAFEDHNDDVMRELDAEFNEADTQAPDVEME